MTVQHYSFFIVHFSCIHYYLHLLYRYIETGLSNNLLLPKVLKTLLSSASRNDGTSSSDKLMQQLVMLLQQFCQILLMQLLCQQKSFFYLHKSLLNVFSKFCPVLESTKEESPHFPQTAVWNWTIQLAPPFAIVIFAINIAWSGLFVSAWAASMRMIKINEWWCSWRF